MTDILCAAQMKDLLAEKSNSRMDGHLKDVKIQQEKLFNITKHYVPKVEPIPENTFTVSSSTKILADIKQNVAEIEKKFSKTVRRSNSNLRKSFEVKEEKFYEDLLPDQKNAGDYFLRKIRTLSNDDQLVASWSTGFWQDVLY